MNTRALAVSLLACIAFWVALAWAVVSWGPALVGVVVG